MKIFSYIIMTLMLFLMIFIYHTRVEEINQLKKENSILKEKSGSDEKNNHGSEKKANVVDVTISWIGGSLSRQTSVVGYKVYDLGEGKTETLNINGENDLNGDINFWFNGGGYAIIASCGSGYVMTKCAPFSKIDSIENQGDQCFLGNEDPNLMRTSMVIGCTKVS